MVVLEFNNTLSQKLEAVANDIKSPDILQIGVYLEFPLVLGSGC